MYPGLTASRAGGALRVLAGLSAAALLAVTACSASSTSDSDGGASKTLTVATVVSPQTLDPAKAVQNNAWLEQLAYEPLIVRRSDGSLAPGLATSWEYHGEGNTTFVLHLRTKVQFSDGTALTAQNVVDHLTYVVASAGQMASFLAGDTFTATDATTVTITSKSANPNFPEIFTQDYNIGGVISSTGLKSPSALGTQTAGAGPYMIDTAQTVAGDHYTYLPNPHYYDPPQVHWAKVVIRVITSPQSVLNAVRTGQADVAVGDPSTVTAARQAGLTVAAAPLLWSGVVLADRGGTMAPALADVRVRQALNYATDRAAIAGALFAGVGQPTNQITVPGGYGYDPALDKTYPYDTAKARSLLTEAGYPQGFTLRMVTPEYQQLNLMAQALKQQWKQVGVNLEITDYANSNQYTSDAFGGKFPAFMTAFGQLPIWMEGPSLLLPSAAFNPLHHADPALQNLYDQAARATGPDRDALDRQVEAYVTDQAWFVPVVTTSLPYYARKTVTGVRTSAKAPLLELYEIRTAG
ncbi:ABC transporter substrate-binding protein [Rugosimonospora acidiphila]|uniref:ABC transporter substrate-binding protein n=1 Tax=Rugosimonospora acidiphila TaxID=556531 RepID=A0ABP9SDN2_9ACTN